MPLYRVRWEIDLDADTAEEAAHEAYKIQKDGSSEATVFDVVLYDGIEACFFSFASEPQEWTCIDPVDDFFKE